MNMEYLPIYPFDGRYCCSPDRKTVNCETVGNKSVGDGVQQNISTHLTLVPFNEIGGGS